MTLSLTAFLIGAIVLVAVAFYFIAKSIGKEQERADSALKNVDVINKVIRKKREINNERNNMSAVDKLQSRKYRD